MNCQKPPSQRYSKGSSGSQHNGGNRNNQQQASSQQVDHLTEQLAQIKALMQVKAPTRPQSVPHSRQEEQDADEDDDEF